MSEKTQNFDKLITDREKIRRFLNKYFYLQISILRNVFKLFQAVQKQMDGFEHNMLYIIQNISHT